MTGACVDGTLEPVATVHSVAPGKLLVTLKVLLPSKLTIAVSVASFGSNVEVHVLQEPLKAQDALLLPLIPSASVSVGMRILMLLQ
jgi:hypothetical protein